MSRWPTRHWWIPLNRSVASLALVSTQNSTITNVRSAMTKIAFTGTVKAGYKNYSRSCYLNLLVLNTLIQTYCCRIHRIFKQYNIRKFLFPVLCVTWTPEKCSIGNKSFIFNKLAIWVMRSIFVQRDLWFKFFLTPRSGNLIQPNGNALG